MSGLIARGRHWESESNQTNGRAQLVIQNIGSDTMVNMAQACRLDTLGTKLSGGQ
jgi:hypothetical protein